MMPNVEDLEIVAVATRAKVFTDKTAGDKDRYNQTSVYEISWLDPHSAPL